MDQSRETGRWMAGCRKGGQERRGNTKWRGDDQPFQGSQCRDGPKKACIIRNLYFLGEVSSIVHLLETKLSSLLTLLEWGSVSVTSLIVQSV